MNALARQGGPFRPPAATHKIVPVGRERGKLRHLLRRTVLQPNSLHSSVQTLGWRHLVWLAALVGASVAFTLGFACAVPFAAFAAAAATTLSRRDALLLTLAVWLANQIVGFTVLGYPWVANTIAWGVALGAVAVATTVAAQWANGRFAGLPALSRTVAVFAAAFVAYEGLLFLASQTSLGGGENFTLGIVAYILALNAVALAGLAALHRLATVSGFIAPRAGSLAAAR